LVYRPAVEKGSTMDRLRRSTLRASLSGLVLLSDVALPRLRFEQPLPPRIRTFLNHLTPFITSENLPSAVLFKRYPLLFPEALRHRSGMPVLCPNGTCLLLQKRRSGVAFCIFGGALLFV
jgi:hypothetical protein